MLIIGVKSIGSPALCPWEPELDCWFSSQTPLGGFIPAWYNTHARALLEVVTAKLLHGIASLELEEKAPQDFIFFPKPMEVPHGNLLLRATPN